MTPAALILARAGGDNPPADAVALWRSIVGHGAEGDAGYVAPLVDEPRTASASLDFVARWVGSEVDVPAAILREAIYRHASYLDLSGATMGLRKNDEHEFDVMASQGSFRRSGAMQLLRPWKPASVGVI